MTLFVLLCFLTKPGCLPALDSVHRGVAAKSAAASVEFRLDGEERPEAICHHVINNRQVCVLSKHTGKLGRRHSVGISPGSVGQEPGCLSYVSVFRTWCRVLASLWHFWSKKGKRKKKKRKERERKGKRSKHEIWTQTVGVRLGFVDQYVRNHMDGGRAQVTKGAGCGTVAQHVAPQLGMPVVPCPVPLCVGANAFRPASC